MLPSSPQNRKSAADYVVDYVKSGIKSGDFKVGEKLPNEAELASSIGVGRSSLREGMRILEAYGLVDIRQGDGTYIDNRSEEKFMEILSLQSASDYSNLMQLRRVIELGSIAIVSSIITEEEINNLDKLADMLVPENDLELCVEADRAFHTKIIEITNNPLIIHLNNMVYENRMSLLLSILSDDDILLDAYTAHKNIVAALKSGDVIRCVSAVTQHLDITNVHISNKKLL